MGVPTAVEIKLHKLNWSEIFVKRGNWEGKWHGVTNGRSNGAQACREIPRRETHPRKKETHATPNFKSFFSASTDVKQRGESRLPLSLLRYGHTTTAPKEIRTGYITVRPETENRTLLIAYNDTLNRLNAIDSPERCH